jgi:arginine/lysine/ornithine decarboxylase
MTKYLLKCTLEDPEETTGHISDESASFRSSRTRHPLLVRSTPTRTIISNTASSPSSLLITNDVSHFIVVRLQSTDKVVVAFSEHSNISVDKRGNFVVIAAVEPSGVVSYSLHAQTNNDALRLLASIELAAYKLGSITGTENRQQTQLRRRIEKTIKEDRRRRHRRRKDDDALVAMLGSANLGSTAVQ